MAESHAAEYAYGLWGLAAINSGLFVWFLLSFAKPSTKIEWRSFGLFSSFVAALFVEMYGFPLTIYFLTSWLGSKYPAANPFSHENGHLLGLFLNIQTGHGTLFHILSNFLIFGGAIIIVQGWKVIHKGGSRLVTEGPYQYVRHPQYIGFIAIILGFLIQWPTFVTLLMAPILIIRYILLAKKEEEHMLKQFPQEYRIYRQKVPAWFPKLIKKGDKSMKKIIALIFAIFIALPGNASLYAQDDKDMGMMGGENGGGKRMMNGMMGGKMDGKMMGMHMMMKMMMEKSLVATSDGGVVVAVGNKLTKYDKDLNVVKEIEVKVDMEAMQKHMEEMMKKCPMMKDLSDKAEAKSEGTTDQVPIASDHSKHH